MDYVTQRSKRPYRRADVTRQHVLDVAHRLFYAHGIRAVGIDQLAAEAEVTTTTLYRLFGSKEHLVAAYLRRTDQGWFTWLERTVSRGGLARLFEELDQQARTIDYRGCPFRLALAEHPAPDSVVHQVAIDNKQRTLARFRDLAALAGCPDPAVTGEHLMMIMEGICASAAERDPSSPEGAGPALVRELLEANAVG